LNDLTAELRIKLDDLQDQNGYDGHRYELTHAPMDVDLLPGTQYFHILHERRDDLDFLMPQFYNGVTRPAVDGVDGTGEGTVSAAAMFRSLSNDLFEGEPNKVSRMRTRLCVPMRECKVLCLAC
jgi:chitinase